MTLENLYKAEFDKILSDYLANIDRQLVVFNTPAIPGDNDIRALLSMERLLSSNVTAIKRIQLPPLEFNPAGTVEAHFDAKEKQSNQERANIQLKADEEKKARIEEHENEKRAVNEHNASLIEPFKAKHKELLDYKEKLDYVFDRYDISPLDIDISDKLTPKEFGILIDKSLAVCDKYSVQKQSGLFDKIAKPLKGEKNLQFTLSYMALLLVCAYVLLPIASVLIFYAMCKSVHGLYRDIEALRIANALMAQIDYNRFVNNDDVRVVSELVTDDIDVKLQEELNSVKDYTKEKQEAVKELKNSSLEISKRINETKDVANKKIADKLKFVEESLAEVQSKIKKFMSSYNPFPYKCSNSVVMERKMILQKVEGKIDVQESVPAKNLAFISDREMAINGMKLFLCNMLLNVKAKQLTVDKIGRAHV